MRGYTQLTRDERYQIYALRKAGHSQKEIAEVLRRNPSTISRELGRNKGLKGYRPEQAHRLAQNRKKERDRTRIPKSTWARVEQLLREDWSPEAGQRLAGRGRKAYRSAMKGFTSMSMRTSDAVAISIVICAARSHAGSAMAITTGEGRSGNGCPSMNVRRWSRRAAALVIGKRTQ